MHRQCDGYVSGRTAGALRDSTYVRRTGYARTREDAVAARLRARLQLKAMLLRHGRAYHGKSSWTQAHERYLAAVSFTHAAQHVAFTEYRGAVRDAHERVERLTEALRTQLESWRMRPVVEALMSLRGIDVVARQHQI